MIYKIVENLVVPASIQSHNKQCPNNIFTWNDILFNET